jgi:hypothetical protein
MAPRRRGTRFPMVAGSLLAVGFLAAAWFATKPAAGGGAGSTGSTYSSGSNDGGGY